jgi:translation initiation factor IF-1
MTGPAPNAGVDGKKVPMTQKEEKIELEGEIIEALRNRMFRLRLDNGHVMIGYTSGKMKRYRIRMLLGDRVRVELSPYDLDRGRIVYRMH